MPAYTPPPSRTNMEYVRIARSVQQDNSTLFFKKQDDSFLKEVQLQRNSQRLIPASSNRTNITSLKKEFEMNAFIEKNNLATYLAETYEHIRTLFAKETIKQELYTDTEANSTKLYLNIISPLPYKEVFAKNRKLFQNWDLAKNKDFNSFVNISAESSEF